MACGEKSGAWGIWILMGNCAGESGDKTPARVLSALRNWKFINIFMLKMTVERGIGLREQVLCRKSFLLVLSE